MSLTLRGVRFTYAGGTPMAQVALSGVDLQVSRGELVLVLGTTGSGKSTLLRIASGLVPAHAGEALLDGRPLNGSTARGRIGLVFQSPESQLFADTLLDDVMFGPLNMGVPSNEARDVAVASMVAVGLDPERFAERSPFSLSGGEARRAALAGVLALRPSYLLADEPTAGLDATGRRAIASILAEARQQAGVVIVTHTAEQFLADADRVVIMRDGVGAWSGTAASLIADPSPMLDAGLTPPPVLEVQRLVAARGIDVGPLTLEADRAASRLAEATGWS